MKWLVEYIADGNAIDVTVALCPVMAYLAGVLGK